MNAATIKPTNGVPVGVESQPGVVVELAPGPVRGEGLDALVGQHAHVDLEAEQGEHRESEDGEDDHIPQVLHGLNHSTNNGL